MSLDRHMVVQTVTLKVAYSPTKCDNALAWDWYGMLDVERDCQIIAISADEPREPTADEEQAIREWDVE